MPNKLAVLDQILTGFSPPDGLKKALGGLVGGVLAVYCRASSSGVQRKSEAGRALPRTTP